MSLVASIWRTLGFEPRSHGPVTPSRFKKAGWSYQGFIDRLSCATDGCGGVGLHAWTKPYETSQGSYRYWAIVCSKCQTLFQRKHFAREEKKLLAAWSTQSEGTQLVAADAASTGVDSPDRSIPVYKCSSFFIREVVEERIKAGSPITFSLRESLGKSKSYPPFGAAIERGINRLCHFTKLSSLPSIFEAELLPSAELKSRDIEHFVVDGTKGEQHEEWIRASVEYPNLWLLDRFRQRSGGEDWVVLLLEPRLLARSQTKFSDVNAATRNGERIEAGSSGFENMYAQTVKPRNAATISRTLTHLESCPTSLQAEVLIQGPIDCSEFLGIVTDSDEARNKALQIMRGLNG